MTVVSCRMNLQIRRAWSVFRNCFACIALLLGLSCHEHAHVAQRSNNMMMQTYDESANGSEITVQPGERFELRLKETPTTGFRWRLTSDGSPICVLESDSFEAPHENIPGRAGRRIFVFHVEHGGHATIELIAQRPWEKGTSGGALFQLSIVAP